MNDIKPIVGQWYRGVTNELFEVVALDDQDATVEIQYFDGTLSEMDIDAWNEQMFEQLIDTCDAPEDWSGALDADEIDSDFEDYARAPWSNVDDRSLRR